MKRHSWKLVVAAMAALGLQACGGSGDSATTTAPQARIDPLVACNALLSATVDAAMIGLPTRGAKVTSTSLVYPSATNGNGEYCLVRGEIASVDTSAQPITFNIAMPTLWNRKLAHLGGGGFNGSVVNATRGTMEQFMPLPSSLGRGYVTIGTDSGHAGNDASFALNDEQLRNYAGDQLKKARDTAVQLIARRYDASAERTFFVGGSNGGREALAVMQRWPQDYDGIIAGLPVTGWMPLAMKMQMIGRALRSNAGAGWLNAEKITTLRNAELSACDELDGLKDNIISNVDACTFDPLALRCTGGADTGNDCLSDAQIQTIKVAQARVTLPYALANGVNVAPAFDKSADWNFGTSPTLTQPSTQATIGPVSWFADQMVRYAILRDPNADSLQFDPLNPGAFLPRLQQVSALLDSTNPNIDAFLEKGGKLIFAHGRSDALVTAQQTFDYYNTLVSRYGATRIDEVVRLYQVPGYAHASGRSFNANGGLALLDALEGWVERGVAPSTLTVVDSNSTPARSRPMCRYPAWPKYKGSGDVNDAGNFTCEVNR
jgi:feruloyl esterase